MTIVRLAIHLTLLLVSLTGAAILLDLSKCGGEKTCEKRPATCESDSDCEVVFSSKQLNDDQIEFEVWAPSKASGDSINYLALGFSKDQKMGDDGVSYCYNLDDGSKGIGIGQTVATTFRPSNEDKSNVELKEIRVEDGQFYCHFVQKVNKGSTDLLKPDLSEDYHIFVVRGKASSDSGLSIHSFGAKDGPFITGKVGLMVSQAVEDSPATIGNNATANGDQAKSGEKPTKEPEAPIKSDLISLDPETRRRLQSIHGALMLVGWLGLLFTSVYAARFLRNHWPNTTVAGLQIWFHIHRLLNVIGIVLIVIATILIFIGTNLNWTGPVAGGSDNTSSKAIHSLLGVISVILAIFQPFMALMRCDKQDRKRPIFNVFHRSFGLLALLLAVIAIGFAVFGQINGFLSASTSLSYGVLIAFFVFVIIVIIAQEFVRIRDGKERQKVAAIELQARNPAPSDSYYYKSTPIHSTRYRHITSLLFVIFGSVSFAVSIFLAYLVLSSV